ncbi:hypothetical protein LOTGIDRAFT_238409, partial [Lottia gigantea]
MEPHLDFSNNIKQIWFWLYMVSEMFQLVQGDSATSYGREFFLPYLNFCKEELFLEIVPTFPGTDHIQLTIEDQNNITIYNNQINQSEVLNISYMELHAGNTTGLKMKTTKPVSVYIKKHKGDMTMVFPTNVLNTQYVLPNFSSINAFDIYHVIMYAINPDTTINFDGNMCFHILATHANDNTTQTYDIVCGFSNVSEDDNTSMPKDNSMNTIGLNSYEMVILESTTLDAVVNMTSDKLFGVLLLVLDNESDSNDSSCVDMNIQTLESIPPASSNGKHFYFSKFEQQTNLTFHITGLEDGTISIETDQSSSELYLTSNETLHCDFQAAKYVSLRALIPVQVHVSTVVVITDTQEYLINDFFLPAHEQFLRCSVNDTCISVCPNVINETVLKSSVQILQHTFLDASNSIFSNVKSEITEHKSDNLILQKLWTNHSFVYITCKSETGSVYPVATGVNKLYAACVRNSNPIVAGDGLDNDCDGLIDEETDNGVDDDGDSLVDEDTLHKCAVH